MTRFRLLYPALKLTWLSSPKVTIQKELQHLTAVYQFGSQLKRHQVKQTYDVDSLDLLIIKIYTNKNLHDFYEQGK